MAMPAAKRFEALLLSDAKKAERFYSEVFEHQSELGGNKAEKYLDSAVQKVGGNVAKIKKEIQSEKIAKAIADDTQEASTFSISGTPGFVVEGISIRGAYPFENFKEIIDRRLAEKGVK